MKYTFVCQCGREAEVDIPMDRYETEKDNTYCLECGRKMSRKIEWSGLASNIGGYSDVAGAASWQRS